MNNEHFKYYLAYRKYSICNTQNLCYLNAKEDGTLFFPLILSLVQFTRAHT